MKPITLWAESDEQHLRSALKGWREAAKAGEPFQVEVKTAKDPRSLQALRFYWAVVLRDVSEQIVLDGRRYSKDVWHEQFKREFIGVVELPNGQAYGISSGTLNSTEFSIFVTQVQAWAQMQHGVEFTQEAA